MKKILIISLVIVASLYAAVMIVSVPVYASLFKRVNTAEIRRRTVAEFPGLAVKECSFTSNHGQKLAGYIYYREDTVPRGVVIIAHGLGVGGQCVHIDAADYFTSHGYVVFAYDATAMDRSEGNTAFGMEQGIIDLQYAIEYVEHDERLKNLPVVLFGHSWGGYSVGAVLCVHPEVKAVAVISGFNDSYTLYRAVFAQKGMKFIGRILTGNFMIIEKIKFGKYTGYSALKGFANTNAGIFIVQSRDDGNVPLTASYDLFYAAHKNDSRFTFRLYENRKHLFIFYTDAGRAYIRRYLKDEETDDLTDYGKTHQFDKKIGYEIDQDLFGALVNFYDTYCK